MGLKHKRIALAGLPEEHADPRDAGRRVPLKVGGGRVREYVRHFVGHTAAVEVQGVAAPHLEGHGTTRALVGLRPDRAFPHRELTHVPHGHAHCVQRPVEIRVVRQDGAFRVGRARHLRHAGRVHPGGRVPESLQGGFRGDVVRGQRGGHGCRAPRE